MKTRLWKAESSNTMIQFRTDAEPLVWMHTNMGWLPLGNSPTDHDEAEKFAAEAAEGYNLKETSSEVAEYFLGSKENSNDDEEDLYDDT